MSMNVTVTISEETKQMMIELASIRIEEFKKDRSALDLKIEEMRKFIQNLQSEPVGNAELVITGLKEQSLEYPYKHTWYSRISFVLKELGKFSNQTNIIAALRKYEDEVPIKTVSGTISQKVKSGELIMLRGIRASLYGLPDWLDNNDSPKQEFI